MAYFLRAYSLVGDHLDRELIKRGAHTSGSTERKQARLQRFMDVEYTLQWVIRNEQQNTRERELSRATEIILQGARAAIREKGVAGAKPDIVEMLMNCPPEVVERVREYVYSKKTAAAHGYNLRSRQ